MKKIGKKELFKEFIEKHEVLIVDKNPGSRNRLLKIMADLGSKRHTLHAVGSFQEAVDIINTKNIGLILSDYYISNGSGFELFKLIREKNPTKLFCTVLVTADMTQSTVAKAAEEDVDSFVIKPYTVDSIQENLINTISNKIQPSQYILTIEEGKALIVAGKYPQAIAKLKTAIPLHAKPALALFYIGQAEYLSNVGEGAQDSYQKGLAYNNIHFKCLVGLFDILMARNQLEDAYQVVKKIAKYFPANEDRLKQIVRLTIQTENYSDMNTYYEIFTTIEERNSLMVNYIGAGMFVSGKHFLKKNEPIKAMALFQNLVVSCSEFTKFPKAIIALLVEHQMVDEAEKFLKRFSPETRNGEDYLISDYLVDASKFKDNNKIVKTGLELYNKNIRDPQCMRVMVDAMKECGYQQEKIAPFLQELEVV